MVQVFLRLLAFVVMIFSGIGVLASRSSFAAPESLMELEEDKRISEVEDTLDRLRLMTELACCA